jgi:citrate synthase
VLADIEVPLGVIRGVALLARCAGLLGHIAEEQRDPIGMDIYATVDSNTDYRPAVH